MTRPSALTAPSCQSPPARLLTRVSANGACLSPPGFLPDSVLMCPSVFSIGHKTHSDPCGHMSPTVFLLPHGREETQGGWMPGIAIQKGYDTHSRAWGGKGRSSLCSWVTFSTAEAKRPLKAAEGRHFPSCQGKDSSRMER